MSTDPTAREMLQKLEYAALYISLGLGGGALIVLAAVWERM